MTALNAATNALLAVAVLIYCRRRWIKGHRGVAAMFSVYAVWLMTAAVARYWRGEYGPNVFIEQVQAWAWIPRMLAAAAFMWMTALNGHIIGHRCPDHEETVQVIKAEVAAVRNGG